MISKKSFALLAIGLFGSVAAAAFAGANAVAPVNFEARLSGTVNGTSVSGSGIQTVSGSAFSSRVELVPARNFHPLATGCALAAMNPGTIALTAPAMLNSGPLGYRGVRESRSVRIEDASGAVIGDLKLDLRYSREGGKDVASMSLSGNYAGPTDLVFPASYDIILRQRGPGRIVGSYVQTVMTSKLTPIFVTGKIEYRYAGDRTLLRPHLMRVRFTSFSFQKGEIAVTEVAGTLRVQPLGA